MPSPGRSRRGVGGATKRAVTVAWCYAARPSLAPSPARAKIPQGRRDVSGGCGPGEEVGACWGAGVVRVRGTRSACQRSPPRPKSWDAVKAVADRKVGWGTGGDCAGAVGGLSGAGMGASVARRAGVPQGQGPGPAGNGRGASRTRTYSGRCSGRAGLEGADALPAGGVCMAELRTGVGQGQGYGPAAGPTTRRRRAGVREPRAGGRVLAAPRGRSQTAAGVVRELGWARRGDCALDSPGVQSRRCGPSGDWGACASGRCLVGFCDMGRR